MTTVIKKSLGNMKMIMKYIFIENVNLTVRLLTI